jgi:hypothetical protein
MTLQSQKQRWASVTAKVRRGRLDALQQVKWRVPLHLHARKGCF